MLGTLIPHNRKGSCCVSSFLLNLDWLKEIENDDCVAAETLFWQRNTLSGACGGFQVRETQLC